MATELGRRCLAEAIGTFFLCFIGIGAIMAQEGGAQIGVLGIALAHGLALAVGITAVAHVSGGHLNPAVTAGLLVTGRIRPAPAAAYVVSQCVGAVAAALLITAIYSGVNAAEKPDMPVVSVAQLGTPAPGKLPASDAVYPLAPVFLTELVLTFLLVFAVFGTAVDERAPRIGGLGIGLTVAFGILMGGTICGGAMNPARAFGPALVGGYWTAHWLYWVAPIAGGVLAAVTYQFAFMPRAAAAEIREDESRPTARPTGESILERGRIAKPA